MTLLLLIAVVIAVVVLAGLGALYLATRRRP
jgi:Tfp pilus assembly protein PilW